MGKIPTILHSQESLLIVDGLHQQVLTDRKMWIAGQISFGRTSWEERGEAQ
jgi:hypothetical protein